MINFIPSSILRYEPPFHWERTAWSLVQFGWKHCSFWDFVLCSYAIISCSLMHGVQALLSFPLSETKSCSCSSKPWLSARNWQWGLVANETLQRVMISIFPFWTFRILYISQLIQYFRVCVSCQICFQLLKKCF